MIENKIEALIFLFSQGKQYHIMSRINQTNVCNTIERNAPRKEWYILFNGEQRTTFCKSCRKNRDITTNFKPSNQDSKGFIR